MSDLIIPRNLIEQIRRGNCVLFVGAGISMGEGGLPSGGQLARELAERCDYPRRRPLLGPRGPILREHC